MLEIEQKRNGNKKSYSIYSTGGYIMGGGRWPSPAAFVVSGLGMRLKPAACSSKISWNRMQLISSKTSKRWDSRGSKYIGCLGGTSVVGFEVGGGFGVDPGEGCMLEFGKTGAGSGVRV